MSEEDANTRRKDFSARVGQTAHESAQSVPDEPDSQTQAGIEKAQEERLKSKPAGVRADEAQDRLQEVLTEDKYRLIQENSELALIVNSLISEKDTLNVQWSESKESLARIKQSHKSMRYSLGLSSLTLGVGGSLVSQFASSESNGWGYFGWGMVVVGSIFILIKVFLDA